MARKSRKKLTEENVIEMLEDFSLAQALWWFIENADADADDRNIAAWRSGVFFYLRERVRREAKP